VRQPAVAAALPENVVAALTGDGGGYKAKGDANATWEEILFVPSEHGRHRGTTAKFSITISYESYRGMAGGKKRHSWGRGD